MICAPTASSSAGDIALTLPYVPTGMKIGVSTAPCASTRRPRRARPSVAVTENSMGRVIPPTPWSMGVRDAFPGGIAAGRATAPGMRLSDPLTQRERPAVREGECGESEREHCERPIGQRGNGVLAAIEAAEVERVLPHTVEITGEIDAERSERGQHAVVRCNGDMDHARAARDLVGDGGI